MNKNILWSIIVIFALISGLFIGNFLGPGSTGATISIPGQVAATKSANFINENLVTGTDKVTVKSVIEKSGLYEVTSVYRNNDIKIYTSLDGKFLILEGMGILDMDNYQKPTQPEVQLQTCEDIEKSDKVKFEVFIESKCPFGVQAVNALTYLHELFKDKVDIIPRYMVTVEGDTVSAMHGEEELLEDKRQVCIREEQPEKFWTYMKCYVETGNSTDCETKSKINSQSLSTCVANKAIDYLKADGNDWSSTYRSKAVERNLLSTGKEGAGSPSFFINGEAVSEYDFNSNGRSPENLKTIACCGMTAELTECSQNLSTLQPPRGFGILGSGEQGSGSC